MVERHYSLTALKNEEERRNNERRKGKGRKRGKRKKRRKTHHTLLLFGFDVVQIDAEGVEGFRVSLRVTREPKANHVRYFRAGK